MNELAHCPEILPPELAELIDCFGRAWANSPSRPCPSAKAIAHWSELLTAWVAADDLPLFVRKHANNRGSLFLTHLVAPLFPVTTAPPTGHTSWHQMANAHRFKTSKRF